MSQEMTIDQFVDRYNIQMTCERIGSRPDGLMTRNMDHWECKLKRKGPDGRRSMKVLFSMGYGHHGKAPELDGVLGSIQSDSSGLQGSPSFQEWAGEYGYDWDDPDTKRIYRAVKKQFDKMERFVGAEGLRELLEETEYQ